MPFTLTMPKLSPTMEEGTIAKWHKKEGDFVDAGELLVEVATDKATVEHNALDEGYLRKLLIAEGDEARVNQPIAVFTAEKAESIDDYEPEGIAGEEPEPVAEEVDSEEVDKRDALRDVPAASMAQPAFVPESPLENYRFTARQAGQKVLASPLARKLAAEKRLDLASVKGSGPRGRIVSADLAHAAPAGKVSFGHKEYPTTAPGSYSEEKLSPMRKAIGSRLQQAKTFIPHFYVTQDIDAGPMALVREQLKAVNVKATFNDFVMRAAALALREHPIVNSGYNSRDDTVIRFETIDISLAVSVDGGLITPIIRHADHKNLGELSAEARELAALARNGKLQEHQYRGGSFTVSNLGMYGISDFAAVINPPQAAILAVGGIQDVPVVKDGAVLPGKRMKVTLSSDHRVIDGAAAAAYLVTLKQLLEAPAALLI